MCLVSRHADHDGAPEILRVKSSLDQRALAELSLISQRIGHAKKETGTKYTCQLNTQIITRKIITHAKTLGTTVL